MTHGNHSFIAYIDESGDEGFVFDKNDGKKNGSSHWFVLSALLVRRINSHVTVELANDIRKAIGIPDRKSIHFKEIRNHHKKLKAIEVLMTGKIKHITILVHKPSLHERETFSVKNTLYFYTARYLLERISWFCRDNRMSKDKNDGSVRVVFSNRASTPYDKFKDYISHIIEGNSSSIAPGVILPEQIEAINHSNSAGLQLVDLVASSFFFWSRRILWSYRAAFCSVIASESICTRRQENEIWLQGRTNRLLAIPGSTQRPQVDYGTHQRIKKTERSIPSAFCCRPQARGSHPL